MCHIRYRTFNFLKFVVYFSRSSELKFYFNVVKRLQFSFFVKAVLPYGSIQYLQRILVQLTYFVNIFFKPCSSAQVVFAVFLSPSAEV